jgi:hypothetical protein
MDIDRLVARFAALPGAEVGHGPRHPTHPDPALEDRVAKLFAEVPALTRDQGFVDFMWRYAGASYSDPTRTWVFEIFGFSDVASSYDEFEEALVEDDGSFMFAQAMEENPDDFLDLYTVAFAFNVDPEREWAVYRADRQRDREDKPFVRYLGSFAELLAEVIAKGGRYPRPSG